MRTRVGILVVMLLAGGMAVAQSNEVVDEILASDSVTFGQAAYMVFLAADEAPDDASVEEVYRDIEWSQWNLKEKSMDDPVRLGEVSYLLMENLGIRGGLMYRMIPGPRYAARELDYLEFLLGNDSPYRSVSGRELLHVIGQALEYTEEDA
ncbi:MAG: hypothetical protein R6V29_12465 [Spirochaetia bacterium]